MNESYKLDAEEKLHQITIASVPHMDRTNARSVIHGYEQMSHDIIDILEEDDNYENLSKLKKQL